MTQQGRVVIVDPAFASNVGHHADVNGQLLEALVRRNWVAECWGDVALTGPGSHGVFNACGYVDPRHWSDLGGTVHLARRMERQLLEMLEHQAGENAQPVAGWVVHTALPFQLLGLARALRHVPPAAVMVSLMFPPGETLEGKGESEAAASICRVVLNALAQSVAQAGHRLRLELPSQQSLELYEPLLAAAGLKCSGLHPAVVGAGLPAGTAATAHSATGMDPPRILLHWGDLKPGKGRQEAQHVVRQLLSGVRLPRSLQDVEWLFHLHSRESLPEAELSTLERAQDLIPRFSWLNQRVETARMQALLAGCDVALLPYDPILYRHRSSGLLWCYGAARASRGRCASVVGREGGWLEREARDLGLNWRSGSDGSWLEVLAAACDPQENKPGRGAEPLTVYGRRMLGESYSAHLVRLLEADRRMAVRSDEQPPR